MPSTFPALAFSAEHLQYLLVNNLGRPLPSVYWQQPAESGLTAKSAEILIMKSGSENGGFNVSAEKEARSDADRNERVVL